MTDFIHGAAKLVADLDKCAPRWGAQHGPTESVIHAWPLHEQAEASRWAASAPTSPLVAHAELADWRAATPPRLRAAYEQTIRPSVRECEDALVEMFGPEAMLPNAHGAIELAPVEFRASIALGGGCRLLDRTDIFACAAALRAVMVPAPALTEVVTWSYDARAAAVTWAERVLALAPPQKETHHVPPEEVIRVLQRRPVVIATGCRPV